MLGDEIEKLVLGTQRAARPQMSSAENELWREMIRNRCGLHFTDSRFYFLEQRLWERMTALNLTTYADYYHFLAHNPKGKREWLTLRDKILNNESSFFRHQPSYDAMMKQALPALMAEKRRQSSTTFTLWSAGCSGGQEPYSMAMAALQRLDPVVWNINVTGTDISHSQLAKAQAGNYRQYEVRYMPAYFRDKYMSRKGDPDDSTTVYSVKPSVKRMVQFGKLNLHRPLDFWLVGQDVIFCQNVLIYFQAQDRIDVVHRLAERLNIGGYLFLGPAEVVGLQIPGMKLCRWDNVLAYQRVESSGLS